MQRSLGGSASPCHGARCRSARCRSAPCQGARCHGARAAMFGVQRRNCPAWLRAGGAAHPCDIPGMSPSVPRWKAPTTATQPGCRATRTGRSTGRGSAPAVPPQAAGADPSASQSIRLSFPSLPHGRTDTGTETGLARASVSPPSPTSPNPEGQHGGGRVPAAPRHGRLHPGSRGFTSPGWKGPKNRLCCQIPGRKCPENSLVCGIAACLCFPAQQMKNNRRKS